MYFMKIAFIACKDNPVEIFSLLAKKISKKISGLELEERFAPFLEDIPAIALECSEESDFIFVFAVEDDENKRKMIEDKLIDVEINSHTRILKVIVEDNFSDLNEEEYEEEKEKLVDEYIDIIVGILFNENEFEPKDKDFSI